MSVADLILGRAKYSEMLLSEGMHELELPEGPYWVKVLLVEVIRMRPRMLWISRRVRAHLEIEAGIPLPDNRDVRRWECDAVSVEEALMYFRIFILRERKWFAGVDWVPGRSLHGNTQ